MANKLNKSELQLDDTIKVNSKGSVILGRLAGPCADVINPTRNGRKYDESLWEKVFSNEIVNEYFQAGGIFGELGHPADRLETDMEKIAICMPEPPKKNDKGQLIGTWDILDTPNGRIAHTLAKYGYKLGISSRGGGDTYEDFDGEHVNEDTYDFQGFDLVLLPAVKAARLKMVESVQNNKTFKAAINEALENATPDEKKIMTETLSNLNISYNKGRYQILVSNRLDFKDEKTKEQSDDLEQLKKIATKYKGKFSNITIFDTESGEDVFELNEEYNHNSVIDNKQDIAANNVGASIVKELQDSLLAKQELETKVTELQEKLSVCYAKEAKYEEDIVKYKSAIRNLSESANSAKALQGKVDNLTEELNKKDLAIKEEQDKVKRMLTKQEASISRQSGLTESISKKNQELNEAKAEFKKLNEQFKSFKSEAEAKQTELNESLEEVKKNLTIKTTEYNNKLSRSNALVEQYRKTAKNAVSKYINLQAHMLGVSENEIKNKLPENYSFNDIDSVCEGLKDFSLKVSKLPINIENKSNIKMTIKESKEPIVPTSKLDDSIDDDLLKLAKL